MSGTISLHPKFATRVKSGDLFKDKKTAADAPSKVSSSSVARSKMHTYLRCGYSRLLN
jgi:hypothetical protein